MSHLDDFEASDRMDSPIEREILQHVTKTLEQIARGNLSQHYKPKSLADSELGRALNMIIDNLNAVVKHVNLVAQGRYDVDFAPLSNDDALGFAIGDMTAILYEMSLENKKSAWIKSGQAELSNIIRGNQNLRELGKNILSFIARYINALVGTIYQVSSDVDDQLELIGSFAIQPDEARNAIAFGDGLVGQCAIEKELLILSDLPPNYLTIGSSLGQIAPRHLILTPFLIEKEIVGVMELGIQDTVDHTKLELLRQISENVAIALKSAKNSEKLNAVLARK